MPSKVSAEKVAKPNIDGEKSGISNETILEAILNLEIRVEETLADLSEQSKQSSVMIASLTYVIQFNTDEVNECKKESRTYKYKMMIFARKIVILRRGFENKKDQRHRREKRRRYQITFHSNPW